MEGVPRFPGSDSASGFDRGLLRKTFETWAWRVCS